ncbi:MAG: cupin domain-containing protein [Pseudomonadota bacterium]
MAQPLRWPANVAGSDAFIDQFWQQRTLFMPAAIDFDPYLDVDDLAGLATLEDVESTLIETRNDLDEPRYAVRQGPFTDATLQRLGDSHWTLLLHDVDVHVPQTRALFRYLTFIPSWRIDNLMVSIAAPGGSVGAHADSYDVLLLQGSGERTWHTAAAGAGSVVTDHPLRLRRDVTFEQHFQARCGDVLYVPPGEIHHGVANSLCTTWSLGMQAPLLSDIAALTDGTVDPGLDAGARYRDDALAPRMPGQILPEDVTHLPITGTTIDQLIIALGILVTQCKAHLQRPPCDPAGMLERADAARLAWALVDGHCIVFANGQYWHTHTQAAHTVATAVRDDVWPADADPELTRWVATTGALQPAGEPPGLT